VTDRRASADATDRGPTDRGPTDRGPTALDPSGSDRFTRTLIVGGRWVLASLFVLGGVAKVASPALYLAMMDTAGLSPARPLLTLVVALELGGGLWLACGLRGHALAALALAAHTLLVNVLLHPFWEFEGGERIAEISFFFKNVSIIGGLLFVAGHARRCAQPPP